MTLRLGAPCASTTRSSRATSRRGALLALAGAHLLLGCLTSPPPPAADGAPADRDRDAGADADDDAAVPGITQLLTNADFEDGETGWMIDSSRPAAL